MGHFPMEIVIIIVFGFSRQCEALNRRFYQFRHYHFARAFSLSNYFPMLAIYFISFAQCLSSCIFLRRFEFFQ